MIDPSARVHDTVDLEKGVRVGARTAIWHRSQIREGARIGEDCVIGGGVFIDTGVEVGDRVKIQNGALVYHGTTVEDGVFIGPGAILTNDRNPRAITTSGELAKAGDWTVGTVVLRHGSSIGAGAVVVAGVEIGTYAMVGAGAVVTRDVGSHALVVGSPARRLGWVCACGVRLHDADGHPAPAEHERYAVDPELHCPSCERRYVYVPDAEALEERPVTKTGSVS